MIHNLKQYVRLVMNSIRNRSFFKFLWGFIGLALLNISVDTSNLLSNEVAENISLNHQESFVEIVVEKMLGYENAIAEQDDHDSDDHSQKKNTKVELLYSASPLDNRTQIIPLTQTKSFNSENEGLPSRYYPIDTPPPKS